MPQNGKMAARMVRTPKLQTLVKTARQLGPAAVLPYAGYQLRLRSGWLRRQTPPGGRPQPDPLPAAPQVLLQPAAAAQIRRSLGQDGQKRLLADAQAAAKGRARLFDGPERSLRLTPKKPLGHWLRYHSHLPDGSDIKPVWEAGRFGWATRLAQAYWLSGEESHAESFWRLFERFNAANPANCGPHWSSAQEVALRLIHWAYCYSLLAGAEASTPARQAALVQAMARHAERIPPTLDYARAQNNNHLLSEGLGLATAAAALPSHPQAGRWAQQGWAAFNEGIARQVHADGAYAQHSSNYQRLMLSLACWAQILTRHSGQPLPRATSQRLAAAAGWLQTLLDEASGQVPNLGPNDGAYVLPLSALPFADFRPVLQAAHVATRGQASLPRGAWDDLALWLGWKPGKASKPSSNTAGPLRLQSSRAWAYLRAARFEERPGHADQLHLDLWWRGHNLAADPGTYFYTAAVPWDNALAGSAVHNTLTIDGRDQMTRASRFLWLDWAQAEVLEQRRDRAGRLVSAAAQHDGYRSLGLRHRRSVQVRGSLWSVRDEVYSTHPATNRHQVRLHWLLPDWPWELQGNLLALQGPDGTVLLAVSGEPLAPALSLLRAGRRLAGKAQAAPTLGWYSPSYASKRPALALLADIEAAAPLTLTTQWTLPD
ncbi:MAG: alginate lyase family protein [Anaerolineales bacterium]|nr:alginate lyase family protein [Anaerolineales bacterium]MCW5855248.1 alginate lyase family protein [Anaerolineales bacterium]